MPEAKEKFGGVNVDDMQSGEFKAHVVRVLNGLDILINLHHNPEALHEELNHLGHQHAERGITDAHFTVLKTQHMYRTPFQTPI